MKKIRNLMVVVMALLCIGITGPQTVFAETGQQGNPNVVDRAELLTEEEENSLAATMKEISDRQSCELVVVTIPSEERGGKSMMAYADDYFDYNGYGIGNEHSGVLLLVSMKEDGHGDYWISTSGYGITALTDAGIDYIGESFVPYLKEKEYEKAFNDFALNCDTFIEQARTGKPYDTGNMPKGPLPWARNIAISLGVGLVVAFVIVSSMKAKLKTVQLAKSATNYVKDGSMHVTESKDIFLYRNVSRVAKPKESSGGGSSTHTSSSGRSHGGGGGSF